MWKLHWQIVFLFTSMGVWASGCFYFAFVLHPRSYQRVVMTTECGVSWFHSKLLICVSFGPLIRHIRLLHENPATHTLLSYTLLSGAINVSQIPSHLPSLEMEARALLVSRDCEPLSLLIGQQRSPSMILLHSTSEGLRHCSLLD